MTRTLDVYGPGGYDPGKPNNNLISSTVIPDDPIVANAATIRAKAAAALTANSTFLGTIAGRRASIATAKTTIATNKATATTGKTATVSTIAQAQTQVRSLWTVMESICTLLDGVATLADVGNDRDEVTMKELNGLIRLALNALDSTADT